MFGILHFVPQEVLDNRRLAVRGKDQLAPYLGAQQLIIIELQPPGRVDANGKIEPTPQSLAGLDVA